MAEGHHHRSDYLGKDCRHLSLTVRFRPIAVVPALRHDHPMKGHNRKTVALWLWTLALAGCAGSPGASVEPLATGSQLLALDDRCLPKSGVGIEARFEADCLRMTEPKRWRGTWRVAFEDSTFTPAGQRHCKVGYCLSLEGKALSWPGRWACAREYEIEFIGRASVWRGAYGHGIPSYKLVVDRLISAKRLADPSHDATQCNAS